MIRRRAKEKPAAHFLHVGKTAGSAIKAALANSSDAGRYRLRLHPHHVTLADVPRGDRFFFVVRDPIDRFVSGFYSRQRKGQPRFDLEWSPGEAAAFSRFATADELAAALSAQEDEARTSAEAAMRAISHVRHSYWTWFGDRDTLLSRSDDLLMVLFQERLDDDFAELLRRLGLDGTEIALPTDEVVAHRSRPDVDRHLRATAVENLQRWYGPEYEFVALTRRLAAGAPAPGRSER